jgi:hypothetical protein
MLSFFSAMMLASVVLPEPGAPMIKNSFFINILPLFIVLVFVV